MIRRISIFLLALVLMLVTFSPVFAYAPTASTGGSSSQSLNLSLDLTVAEVGVEIGTLEAVQSFDDINPRTTAGAGEGINVDVTLGEPGDLPVDLINVASSHTLGDGPNPDTDSDSLGGINTLLIEGGATSMDTSSLTTELGATTTLNWMMDGLTVHGDILGASNLIVTGPITGTSDTESNDGSVVSTAHSEIDDFALEVPLGLGLEILSVDSISTTVRATSDGTTGGTTAYARSQFVNLRILGEEISDVDPGTVVDLEALGINIGSVTIRPVEETTIAGTQSSAQAVALRIELLEVLGLTGVNVDIGTATAQAGVQSGFPTTVTVTDMYLTTGDNLPYATVALGILASLMGMMHLARRK